MKIASSLIVFCTSALVVIGLVTLFSATIGMPESEQGCFLRQLIWCGIGAIACVTLANADYAIIRKAIWMIVPISLLLLMAVLVPGIGVVKNGARRWIEIGSFSFQPSELAKFAVIIGMAAYFETRQRFVPEFLKGFIVPGVTVGFVLLLIILGKDYGTTALVASVAGMVMLVAGVRLRYMIPTALSGLAGFVLLVLTNPVRRARIDAWLNPGAHQEGAAWQADQAMVALGRGGVFGVGLGDGRQKLGFIPEHHTDFILAVLGEELGFIGTLAVILLFVTLIFTIIHVAVHAREPFGFYLALGIALLIGMQAFINIGVVTSALPNKGIALPFVSYGGSSLVTMFGAIGLVLSVARHGGVSPVVKKRERSNPFLTGRPAAQMG